MSPDAGTGAGGDVVGIVGLGNMGSRFARRLLDAGFEVLGYDTRPIEIAGLRAVADLDALAREADTLVTSLPDGAAVEATCARLAAVPERRARTLVEMSTIGPDAAERASGVVGGAGMTYVDAPVSGGISGAEAGTLAMMIATDPATLERVEPLLAPIAANRFLVGERPGQGQAMKLLNNFVSATAMLATSEAVAFGVQRGLDPALIVDVLNASSGRTTASTGKFPRAVLPGTYDYGFSTHLMTKDAALFADCVRDGAALHEVADLVAAAWRRFEDAAPDSDLTYVYEWVRAGGAL